MAIVPRDETRSSIQGGETVNAFRRLSYCFLDGRDVPVGRLRGRALPQSEELNGARPQNGYVGANLCVRPGLKGRHAGLPLRLRARILPKVRRGGCPPVIPAQAGIHPDRVTAFRCPWIPAVGGPPQEGGPAGGPAHKVNPPGLPDRRLCPLCDPTFLLTNLSTGAILSTRVIS